MNKPLFPDVTVNGTPISAAAIAAEAQNHPAPKGKPGLAWKAAARALVVRQLLLDEAARQGLTPDPQEIAPGKWETPDEALIRAVTDAAIEVTPPTPDEVRAVWAQNPDRYASPPLWEVSHILCSGADAAARAAALAQDLTTAPEKFAALAKAQSDCPSGQNGGMLGQLSPGDTVPEFEAALRGLDEGTITPAPVQTRFGWHLIRMDGLAPGRPLPFEVVAPRLTAAMEKARWTAAAKDYTRRLFAGATVAGVDLGPMASEG